MSALDIRNAWRPDALDLAALILVCSERGDELSMSHLRLGQWSFWRTGHAEHVTICEREGATYVTDTTIGRGGSGVHSVRWANKPEVLRVLWLTEEALARASRQGGRT